MTLEECTQSYVGTQAYTLVCALQPAAFIQDKTVMPRDSDAVAALG